jgi:hypothetical protein
MSMTEKSIADAVYARLTGLSGSAGDMHSIPHAVQRLAQAIVTGEGNRYFSAADVPWFDGHQPSLASLTTLAGGLADAVGALDDRLQTAEALLGEIRDAVAALKPGS